MQSNQSNAPIGVNSYGQTTGTVSTNPLLTILSTRDPNTYDFNYPIKQRWINTDTASEFILTTFTNVSGQSLAIWLSISAEGTAVNTLTGNSGGAVPPTLNNINLVGDGTTINIVGNPSTSTLTASLVGVGPAVESITVQVGTTTITPINGNVIVDGGAVAAAGVPVQTSGNSGNVFTVQAQVASAQAVGSIANAGLSSYNSSQFSVNSSSGFVSLVGGTTAAVETIQGDDSAAIVPTSGNISLTGVTVANAK